MPATKVDVDVGQCQFLQRMIQRANARKLELNESAADNLRKIVLSSAVNKQLTGRPFETSALAKSCNDSRKCSGDSTNVNNKILTPSDKYKQADRANIRNLDNETDDLKNLKNKQQVRNSCCFYEALSANQNASTTSKNGVKGDSSKWQQSRYGGSKQVKRLNVSDYSFLEETISSRLEKRIDQSLEKQGDEKSKKRVDAKLENKMDKKLENKVDTNLEKPQKEKVNIQEEIQCEDESKLDKNSDKEVREQLEMSIDYTNRSLSSIVKAIEEIDRKLLHLEKQRKRLDGQNVYKPTRMAQKSEDEPGKLRKWSVEPGEHFEVDSRTNDSFDSSFEEDGGCGYESENYEESNATSSEVSSEFSSEFSSELDDSYESEEEEEEEEEEEDNNSESHAISMDLTVLNGGSKLLKKFARQTRQREDGGKMVPNLESTRRSSKMDLSRKGSLLNLESTISSITTFTTHESLDELRPPAEKYRCLDSSLPPEVERFLEDALGDEHNDTSVTYAPLDDTASHYNVSDFISDAESQDQKTAKPDEPQKSLRVLNLTRTIYKSLTEKLRKRLNSQMEVESNMIERSRVAPRKENAKLRKLVQELDIQQTLFYQASKALSLCHAVKNFTAGREHVESERLLLLTDLKKKAISEEIRRVSRESTLVAPRHERGEMVIKDIVLPLKNRWLEARGTRIEALEDDEDVSEWFVVTVSQGNAVWASQAIPRNYRDVELEFPGTVTLRELAPDFKVALRVYSLRLKGAENACNSPGKSPGKTVSQWKASYNSVKNMWRRSARQLAAREEEILRASVRNTSFVLAASLELTLDDAHMTSPWVLLLAERNSTLGGIVNLNMTCRLNITAKHAGFLTYGDESSGGFATWNRRWCVLEGHTLKFWNYPQEQETKSAYRRIDLTSCISKEVTMVDRRYCAKPRTMLIKTERLRRPTDRNSLLLKVQPDRTIVRNLLACDTAEDLVEWTSKLNHVISALHEWRAISTDHFFHDAVL